MLRCKVVARQVDECDNKVALVVNDAFNGAPVLLGVDGNLLLCGRWKLLIERTGTLTADDERRECNGPPHKLVQLFAPGFS